MNLKMWLPVLIIALAGCEQAAEPVAQEEAAIDETVVESPEEVSERINAMFAEYDEEFLALNPIFATFRGDNRYNDQWGSPDLLSDEYAEKTFEMDQRYLASLLEFDPETLNTQDRLSYEIFKFNRENSIEGFERGFVEYGNLTPVSQLFSIPNFVVLLGSGANAQPFATPQDYDNWISRSNDFPNHVDVTIELMNRGIEKGVVQPRILMEKALPQLSAQVIENAEESSFWQPIVNMPEDFSDEDRERVTAAYRDHITNVLVPAYKKLHDYIANDYMPHTRETIGQSDIPGGAEFYAFNVKNTTTTDLTPQEIHDIGKREAARLYAEMEKVKDQVGFEGDMQEFFEHLRTDPQFYYDQEQDLIDAYDELRATINPALDNIFDVRPKTDYVVKAVEPFRAPAMAAAQYFPGTPDGSRPGIFYVNTYELDSRPKYVMEALSLHEASPGHHFQISITQELENIPNFRRFGGFTAYIEGWGLYAESLGPELGLYTDPYQYFGSLFADIWRANRLVVDTGMHALGWTRQQALDWMKSNSPMSEQDGVAEVERYIAIPSQALAYKIGQLKIRELRTRGEEALGDNFDVAEFHNEVLTTGALPLSVLEAKIDRWIESEQSSTLATQ